MNPLHLLAVHRDVRLIRRSGQFDAAQYLAANPDIGKRAADPIRHYCESGWKEGRNPCSGFDTTFYLKWNPDVAQSGVNPFVHFLRHGQAEGRPGRAMAGPVDTPRGPGAFRTAAHEPLSIAGKSLADRLRALPRPRQHAGLLARCAMAGLIFPATFFHYDNGADWFRALTRGRPFFAAPMDQPTKVQARLRRAPTPLRWAVGMAMGLALRIRRNGGLLPVLYGGARALWREGAHGVYWRLIDQVPRDASHVDPAVPAPQSDVAAGTRILVMDYRVPMPDVSAGERATFGVVADLCSFGFDVTFLPRNLAGAPGDVEALRRAGAKVITRADGYASVASFLAEMGAGFSAFYLFRVEVAEAALDAVRQVAGHAPIVFHAPDVHFIRQRREAALRADVALRNRADEMRERELAVMRRVDHVVIVSPAELPALRADLPDQRISVFPALYAPVIEHPEPYGNRKDIFFLGGFAHAPNVDAVTWFVREIWPLVHERMPEVRFRIVGAEATEEVRRLADVPGVIFEGFVADLAPILAGVRLGVAPLRFGAGIKGKVGMTLGAGVPCVCTSIAAEGMGLVDGRDVAIADAPADFADAVVRAYGDRRLWEVLARSGQEAVRRRFGAEANRNSLLRLLNEARLLPLSLYRDICLTAPAGTIGVGVGPIDVSVIVSPSDRWSLTQVCLNAVRIACDGDACRYEILLADDSPTDEARAAAAALPGLRTAGAATNGGDLRRCNDAARRARGRYLLFLNQDTLLLPGAMQSLCALLDSDPAVAIAGSKLLGADASIREAGCVIWSDGSVEHCGRRLDRGGRAGRDARDYATVREVDLVSGAAMLVRHTFWKSVGGFDERFAPESYEDADLCMTARARGFRVLYEPRSEAVRLDQRDDLPSSGVSGGSLRRDDRERFEIKWHAELAARHLPAGSPRFAGLAHAERTASTASMARRQGGRLHILYFSPFPSHPSNHGNKATIQQFGRRFQGMGHRVHFAVLQSHFLSPDALDQMRACWNTLDVLPNSCSLGADGNPIPFDGWYEEGLGEAMHGLCLRYDIDIVFCSYVFQSRLLEFVPAHVLKVIDTHDKMGGRYDMLRESGQPVEFFSCTPEEEGAYLRRADVVVARRAEEARYFDGLTGRHSSVIIPHVEEPRFAKRRFDTLGHVGIVASANRINLMIVRDFLATLERQLGSQACPFIVHVAGQVRDMIGDLAPSARAVFGVRWVRWHGYVPDIENFYGDMDLIVAPVTIGTGINVKTVQAMAFGMPLLTTACGVKGIETGEPLHEHQDVESLVRSLLALPQRPGELNRLAEVSRQAYLSFMATSLDAIGALLAHPKLWGLAPAPGADSPREAGSVH